MVFNTGTNSQVYFGNFTRFNGGGSPYENTLVTPPTVRLSPIWFFLVTYEIQTYIREGLAITSQRLKPLSFVSTSAYVKVTQF